MNLPNQGLKSAPKSRTLPGTSTRAPGKARWRTDTTRYFEPEQRNQVSLKTMPGDGRGFWDRLTDYPATVIIRNVKALLFVTTLLVCVVFNPAHATVMLNLNLYQLVGRSDAIFAGKVIKVVSRWTNDQRRIVTDNTFVVSQGIYGIGNGQTVTVRTLGGTVNGIGMRVSGSPKMRRGDQTILFIEKRGSHRYVVGMQQGVFQIYQDIAGQAKVRRDLHGVTFTKSTKPRTDFTPTLLNDFVTQIHQTISTCNLDKSRCAQL
ncbi:MAG: hypothetical protein V1754_07305 [Pseudomonadota bacterium]